jgi:hypothetical protein
VYRVLDSVGVGSCVILLLDASLVCLDRFWVAPSLLSSEYRRSFSGGKATGHEAHHSLATSAEVKNRDL